MPPLRSARIRRASPGAIVGGRPSRTPCARFTAKASRVRWPIRRRSNCAKVASTCAIASPGRRRRVDGAVQRHERPALRLRPGHHGREVEHRAAEPVELGDDERVGAPPLELLQRGPDAGPPHVLRAVAGVLEHPDDLPAAPLALDLDRRALRLKPGAAVGLLFGAHADARHHSQEAPPYRHPGDATRAGVLTPTTTTRVSARNISGQLTQEETHDRQRSLSRVVVARARS